MLAARALGVLRTALGAAFAVFALVSAEVALAQEPGRTCAERVVVRGDDAAAEELRRAISASRLSAWSSASCEGAEIVVSREDGVWTVTVRRPQMTSEHSVAALSSLIAWIESWLAPPAELPAALDRASTDAPTSTTDGAEVRARAAPVEAQSVGPAERRTPPPDGRVSQVALRFFTDVDDRPVVWPGLELALRLGITRGFWVGAAISGAWTPIEDGVQRRIVRLAVRAGWKAELGEGVVALGAGFGLDAADGSRQTPVVLEDEQAGPFVELVSNYDLAIDDAWVVSFAVLGQYYVPDSIGEGPHVVVPFEPEPLGAFSVSLQVGIGWNLARST